MAHGPLPGLGSKKAELVYALDENDRIVSISDVPSGAACRCRCPGCLEPLIAKKGYELTHHFSHEADRLCSSAPETALHRLAKQIVHDRLLLFVSTVTAAYLDQSTEIYKARVVKFDRATMERRLSSIVPDLYVELGDRRLLIEILVTHACDEAKQANLRAQGIASLEIDVSGVPRDATYEVVAQAVLYDAPRKWIFHPQIDSTVAVMRERHEQKRAAAARAFQLNVDRLRDLYETSDRELTSRHFAPLKPDDLLSRAGLGDAIGIAVGGAGCFAVAPAQWQYTVLRRAFLAKDDPEQGYRIKALYDWLKGNKKIRPDFYYADRESQKALAEQIAGYRSPYEAIETYLDSLVTRGILAKHRSYTLSQHVYKRVLSIREADETRAERRKDVLARAERILAAIPVDERAELTAERWICVPQASGLSFEEVIAADHASFTRLMNGLGDIESMLFWDGNVSAVSLGFPLEAESARRRTAKEAEAKAREDARLAKRKEQEEGRRSTLCDAAAKLGNDADDWVAAPHPQFAGKTPIDMAIGGNVELDQALLELGREVRRRRELRAKEEEQRWLHEQLDIHTTQILGAAARPFVASPYALGPDGRKKRPIDYCTSLAALNECLELARRVQRERR